MNGQGLPQAFWARWSAGESDETPGGGVSPILPFLNTGSGKLGTPWWRMHREKSSAARRCAAVAGGGGWPPVALLMQVFIADLNAGEWMSIVDGMWTPRMLIC